MKNLILFLVIVSASSFGCKSKQNGINPALVGVPRGTTLGKVSHQYAATGCPTVVIVKADEPITLIPKEALSSEFDVDGLEIYFDYKTLKIRNPAGCSVGIPAAITNVSKKK